VGGCPHTCWTSGLGREFGREFGRFGLEAFLETQAVFTS
jgi:hypothetical protein